MSRRDLEFPYDPILKQYARENRSSGNPAEIRIWKKILSMREISPYKWTRQKPILHFILDFYCAGLKIAIEVDGDTHSEKVKYDEMRTRLLKDFSIQVIRYTNYEVLNNIEGIWEDLKEKMKTREVELGVESKFE